VSFVPQLAQNPACGWTDAPQFGQKAVVAANFYLCLYEQLVIVFKKLCLKVGAVMTLFLDGAFQFAGLTVGCVAVFFDCLLVIQRATATIATISAARSK
jgi:hypothetical protein